jgi:transcriptional regulator with XRE-family HTH domain
MKETDIWPSDTATVSKPDLHIGKRIAAARSLFGLSQESLAQRLGITPAQVREYEEGKNVLSAGRVYETARALGVSVSYFYDGLNGVTSCPYALTGQHYALLRNAMQRIAADNEMTPTGHRRKLPRHVAINVARQVCEALGWDYSKASLRLP